MKDVDIIQEAYENSVKQVYTVFFKEYSEAPTSAEQEQAEQSFVNGVTAAKKIRDRALNVLP